MGAGDTWAPRAGTPPAKEHGHNAQPARGVVPHQTPKVGAPHPMTPAWQGSTRASRLPPRWAKLRAAILERDQGICYLCGQPGADTVDHIVAGDNHHPDNLAAVHDRTPPHCHRDKTRADIAATRAKLRPPTRKHPGLID